MPLFEDLPGFELLVDLILIGLRDFDRQYASKKADVPRPLCEISAIAGEVSPVIPRYWVEDVLDYLQDDDFIFIPQDRREVMAVVITGKGRVEATNRTTRMTARISGKAEAKQEEDLPGIEAFEAFRAACRKISPASP